MLPIPPPKRHFSRRLSQCQGRPRPERLQFNEPAIMIGAMTEIIFEVRDDEVDGGFNASALGLGIHTEAETLEELRANVREAVDCYFDDGSDAPRVIRLHFVRDEVLAR
jgi:predicted RNase H-like HicB family nuclease